MLERLLVLGAGYTGMELIRQASAAGYDVLGTSRTDARLEAIEAAGATALRWDVLNDTPDALKPWLGAHTTVVYSIPTLFEAYEEPPEGALARHVAPMDAVLKVCVARGAARFIYLSATSVYGGHDGAWVDETTVRQPTSPYGKMRRDLEDCAAAHAGVMPVNIARIVGIYGPGRTLIDYISSGRYTVIDRDKITNRVHVEDIAQSVLAMAQRAPARGARVYNLSDGDPKTVGELVDFLVDTLGIEPPPEEDLQSYAERVGPNAASRWANTLRCSNRRLVEELGVTLRYPDVFAGYRALIAQHYLKAAP